MNKTPPVFPLFLGAGLIAGGVYLLVNGGSVFAAILVVIGLVAAGKGGHALMAASAFKHYELTCERPVKLGELAEVLLVLDPAKPLNLGPASKLTLKCCEKAYYSAGTRSRTYVDDIYTHDVPLELPRELSRGSIRTPAQRSAERSANGRPGTFKIQ